MDDGKLLVYRLGIVAMCLLHMVTLRAGMNFSLSLMNFVHNKFAKKENVNGSVANLRKSRIIWATSIWAHP